MKVSVEIPVVCGKWLLPCVQSVLEQSVPDWHLYLLWDGGDSYSKEILEKLEALRHPKISVFYRQREGAALARKFLTEHSQGEFIFPLNDRDLLAPGAVKRMLECLRHRPWSGIVRAGYGFIGTGGEPVDEGKSVPLEPRQYYRGMTVDPHNVGKPYIVRRSVYDRTRGWDGSPDYRIEDEDCDLFLKTEEIASIEHIDSTLYYCRVPHALDKDPRLTALTRKIWGILTDGATTRRGGNWVRTNDEPPFAFHRRGPRHNSLDMIDCVIPFWESDREELPYTYCRPSARSDGRMLQLTGNGFNQKLETGHFDQIALACFLSDDVKGVLHAMLYADPGFTKKTAESEVVLGGAETGMKHLFFSFDNKNNQAGPLWLRIEFRPGKGGQGGQAPRVCVYPAQEGKGNEERLMMRLFCKKPGYSREQLNRCIRSLTSAGISRDAVHVIEKRQSASANRNEGLRKCTRPWVCFMDDDVEIMENGVFEKLLAAAGNDEAELVGPKLLDGAGRIFCADPYFENMMPKPRGLGEVDHGSYDYIRLTPWLPTTFLLTRREVSLATGGFDESYLGTQMEDVDYCLNARSRGFRCLYAGSTAVVHHNRQRNDRFYENTGIFIARWRRRPELFEPLK